MLYMPCNIYNKCFYSCDDKPSTDNSVLPKIGMALSYDDISSPDKPRTYTLLHRDVLVPRIVSSSGVLAIPNYMN